jgi:hypothetical protein
MDLFQCFELLHYDKYFTHIVFCVFVQRLVPHFYKFDDGKCCRFFANAHLYAAFGVVHRFAITFTTNCVFNATLRRVGYID